MADPEVLQSIENMRAEIARATENAARAEAELMAFREREAEIEARERAASRAARDRHLDLLAANVEALIGRGNGFALSPQEATATSRAALGLES